FPIAVLPLPSLPWQEAQCCPHSAEASAPNAAPEEATMIVTITEIISFINLGFLSKSVEGYTDTSRLYKTNFRCPASRRATEPARVQTGLAIMLTHQLWQSESSSYMVA